MPEKNIFRLILNQKLRIVEDKPISFFKGVCCTKGRLVAVSVASDYNKLIFPYRIGALRLIKRQKPTAVQPR